MPDLTFGEQVKIVLGRKGMTIKELAEMVEERTGKKMSRQNLTQRLGRDNFQEQDMRMIASILECPFTLSILEENTPEKQNDEIQEGKSENNRAHEDKPEDKNTTESKIEDTENIKDGEIEDIGNIKDGEIEDIESTKDAQTENEIQKPGVERNITVGEFLDIKETSGESGQENLLKELLADMDSIEREGREREKEREERAKEREHYEEQHSSEKRGGWMSRFFRRKEEKSSFEERSEEDAARDFADTATDQSDEIYDTDEMQNENVDDVVDSIDEIQNTDEIQDADDSIAGMDDVYDEDEDIEFAGGEINPYTGREYATNSVRMHPRRIGYVQVYNRKDHKWTDMTEWAFLGYQERKKVLLGKDYEPPIYLD